MKMIRRDVVPCPQCKAEVGQPCVNLETGTPHRASHIYRIRMSDRYHAAQAEAARVAEDMKQLLIKLSSTPKLVRIRMHPETIHQLKSHLASEPVSLTPYLSPPFGVPVVADDSLEVGIAESDYHQ